VVDNCAICRNHIMDLCKSWLSFFQDSKTFLFSVYLLITSYVFVQALSAKQIKLVPQARSALLPGVFVLLS
jgi:hypothetical protein